MYKLRSAVLPLASTLSLAAAFVYGSACTMDRGWLPAEEAGSGGVGGASGKGGTTGTAGDGGTAGTAGTSGGGSGGTGGVGGQPCEAPKVVCSAVCVDTQSDAAHCGECGYACGAGSICTEGVCSPVAIVQNAVAPYAFALDASSLYFVVPVNDSDNDPLPAVQKVPKGGGTATSVFAGSFFRSRSLALSGSTLFFGDLDNGGVIRKGATAGGDVDTHVTGAQPAVQQLLASDGQLWWSALDPNSFVRRAPVEVANVSAIDVSFQNGRVDALAVENAGGSTFLYWVNRDTSPSDNKSGLWRKLGVGAEQRLASGAGLRALALGAVDVFVASGAGISKTTKSAPNVLSLVLGAKAAGGGVWGLAVSNGKLYWLAYDAESGGEAGAGGAAGAGGSAGVGGAAGAGGSGPGVPSLALHRANLDGSGARVLGRVAVKSPAYWQQPIGAAQLTLEGGFVYFADPGTLTGDTQAAPNLQGVTGAADGAIYRLPQ